MYQWRQLTPEERKELLASRQRTKRPWHSPPHWKSDGPARFHLTAACYDHALVIGHSPARMAKFAEALFSACEAGTVLAWCILPNHYHLLVETDSLRKITAMLGQFHGRTSRAWNAKEGLVGRKIFHRTADRQIRSDAHFWATVNYIHHNPVRHGYVSRWTDWPWSSASDYLASRGREEAERIWRAYPILDYGKTWDPPGL